MMNESTESIKNNPSKDNIMLRHHLIIQNILNNISLAIRNREDVQFSVRRIEISEEKILIQGLQFKNPNTEDSQ